MVYLNAENFFLINLRVYVKLLNISPFADKARIAGVPRVRLSRARPKWVNFLLPPLSAFLIILHFLIHVSVKVPICSRAHQTIQHYVTVTSIQQCAFKLYAMSGVV